MSTDTLTGPELDAAIAVEVMGWTAPRIGVENAPPFPLEMGTPWDYFNPPPEVEAWRSDYHWRDPSGACWQEIEDYSTDIAAAWQVVERMRHVGTGHELCLNRPYQRGWRATFMVSDLDISGDAVADTAPEAICRAALRAVRETPPADRAGRGVG